MGLTQTPRPAARVARSTAAWIAHRSRAVCERNGGPWVVTLLAIVVVGALALRIAPALGIVGGEGKFRPSGDAFRYAALAESLYLDGGWGAPGVSHATDFSPGGPLFYAATYFLSGGVHPRAALLGVAVVQAVMVVLVFLLTRRLAVGLPGRRPDAAGLAAAAAVAIYPSYATLADKFFPELLAAPLVTGVVLGMLWAAGRSRTWPWIVPGICLGATVLIRPEYLIFVPILAVVTLLKVRPSVGRRRALGAASVFVLAALLPIVPWTVRNYVDLHRVVPVTTGGGKVLFEGTYLPGGGTELGVKRDLFPKHPEVRKPEFRPLPALTEYEVQNAPIFPVLDRIAAERYPNLTTDAALARMGRENIWRNLSKHPLRYARMTLDKVWIMWSSPLKEALRGVTWPERAFHLILVGFGVVGLAVLLVRRRWEAALIAVVLVTITAVGAITLSPPRRNTPLIPLVACLASVGAFWLAAPFGRSAGRLRLVYANVSESPSSASAGTDASINGNNRLSSRRT